MISGTRHCQPALFGRMAQHDATPCRMTGSWIKNPGLKRLWPVADHQHDGSDRFMRRLRRDHDRGIRIEERHRVGNGGYCLLSKETG